MSSSTSAIPVQAPTFTLTRAVCEHPARLYPVAIYVNVMLLVGVMMTVVLVELVLHE